ncbi:hypothetical protein D3C71_1618650 [compost metagenome]
MQREKQHQQQCQPENRHRKAQQRKGADGGVLPFASHHTGNNAQRNADKQRQSEGQQAQLHSGRKHFAQLFADCLAINAGDAKIPVQQADKVKLVGIQQGSAVQRRPRCEIAEAKADQCQEEQGDQQK